MESEQDEPIQNLAFEFGHNNYDSDQNSDSDNDEDFRPPEYVIELDPIDEADENVIEY